MTQILITALLALALDRYLPDRGGFKLWVWYGDWVDSIEQRFNGGSRANGVSAALLATVPILLAVFLAHFILGEISWFLAFLFDILAVYLCVDLFRLGNVAEAVSSALENNDVPQAAQQLGALTGKETAETTEAGVAHAAVEAVLKQANSLVIAPLFWFIILGPFGVVLQHMASILDKLWGHRNERYSEFGWAAARLDDLLGWIPARITAISYAVMGSFEDALHCWRRRAGMWSDINSGPLLASGLGAMHMTNCEETEEEDAYGNKIVRPSILADAAHVRRVMALVWRVLLFWLAVAVLMSGAHLFGLFAR
ncbi:MAG: regulatory signaling modulator protein AmpE [Gammaproteobacteria bacterium]|nr:regulatory signaling modulator protein AmpE [Gammaproteobacteria bacterium]